MTKDREQQQQQYYSGRRPNSLRPGTLPSTTHESSSTTTSISDAPFNKSSTSLLWLAFHGFFCLISIILGFRFSRLAFFLILSPATNHTSSPTLTTSIFSTPTPVAVANHTESRVVAGRHGIRIRPWPHPNPNEVMMAHKIIERVQKEQRFQYGVKNPKPVIAITPTHVRTFQSLHLSGLMHSLLLMPYDLTWIVVEAGGVTNETSNLLAMSKLKIVHISVGESMPVVWVDRHRLERRMRLKALRVVRERRLDGIVVFADDSNMHSMELFDEIQKVSWFGAVSVGILIHSHNSNSAMLIQENETGMENSLVPVQGPACNSSGQLIGWHTFNTLPYAGSSAIYVGDDGAVLPTKLEWSGFVLNSRLLWNDTKDKPDWVQDLDNVLDSEEGVAPLVLLKDASFVEPLGNCGRKVMLWWLRVEARSDSKFPPGWIIDPPLEITVPAKRTPWTTMRHQTPYEKTTSLPDHAEKRPKARTSRPRHTSRSKRKHESHEVTQTSKESRRHVPEK